ncbi:MAG: VWA domain-containing protein [bacterium]|nr:VWA domain-containing protein [bacterium]
MIHWDQPEAFLLFVLVAAWLWFEWRVGRFREPSLRVPAFQPIRSIVNGNSDAGRKLILFLRTLAVIALVLAIARPQTVSGGERSETEGVDIILAIDVSGSMLSLDFKPQNRLEAAKEAAKQFVAGRPNDRVGLVVFSKEAYTQCPLTTDHVVLNKMIDFTKVRELEEDGTAIGAGLTVALARLETSKAPSKIIILLTDGVNNQMVFPPIDAAEKAKQMNVKVYTVGVGKMGEAPYPVPTPMGIQMMMVPVEIDEVLLNQIADQTGGTYNRATDPKTLKTIYTKIDQMERYKIEGVKWRRVEDRFHWFVLIALLFLSIELALRSSIYRTAQ